MENKITKILAEEIKDSRGNPTLKVIVWSGDISASFSVPSGASTGAHEAHELRDADGKGIKDAVYKVNNLIAGSLINKDVFSQKEIDQIMIDLDGTPNKDNIGGNSMIGVSIACAKLAAKISNQEVFKYLRTLTEIKPSISVESGEVRKAPYLYMNLINGGKHAKNDLAFQEYHIVPNTEDVEEAIEIGIKIQNTLKKNILLELGEDSLLLGDEGGFAPKISDIKKPLDLLTEAIKQNYLLGKVFLALDVAASSFYTKEKSGDLNGFYKVDNKNISKDELMIIYRSLIKEYSLFSIEDPFDEEDFESFKKLKENNLNLKVVGDDLTVTNKILLAQAIKMESINTMIIKPNQIGTLSETLETMKMARENDIELIVSHRSGETDDDFIADLAFAFGCFGLKSGAPEKFERKIKYDRLKVITKIN
ncbi:MAG: phosphopyruvate hydratase [Candidatus Paceibacterota bacterium]